MANVTREQLVNVIASHQQDRYQSDLGGGSAADLRAELAAINERSGFAADVAVDGDGQRWLRYEGIVLDADEMERVVTIATQE